MLAFQKFPFSSTFWQNLNFRQIFQIFRFWSKFGLNVDFCRKFGTISMLVEITEKNVFWGKFWKSNHFCRNYQNRPFFTKLSRNLYSRQNATSGAQSRFLSVFV